MNFFKKISGESWAVAAILVASAVVRTVSAFVVSGESGGDFYNYLLMGKSLLAGGSIFIEKRLPIYALLLIPGHLVGHPLGYARVLGIVLAILTLYFFYRLLKDLRLPSIVVVTSLILLSFQPTFFLFSIRPLSHTLFDLEVIMSLYLFVHLTTGFVTTKKINYLLLGLFGLVLGIMSMTRHEGFLVTAVFLVCLFIFFFYQYRLRGLRTIASTLFKVLTLPASIFILTVLPWFISNYQRFGNFLYTQYQTDNGLNVAYNLTSVLENLNKMRQIFIGIWSSSSILHLTTEIIPIIFILVWLTFGMRLVKKSIVLASGLIILGVLAFVFRWPLNLGFVVAVLSIGLTAIGLFSLTTKIKWQIAPIIIIFLTQFAFLTLVQPWSRHSQHLFFIPILLLSFGFYKLVSTYLTKATAVCCFIFVFPIIHYFFRTDVQVVKDYNTSGLKNQPLSQTLVDFQKYPDGEVLISTEFNDKFNNDLAMVEYYLGSRITYDWKVSTRFVLDYNDSTASSLLPKETLRPLVQEQTGDNWAQIYEVTK
ncbi:MAG: hypothetical protein NT141_03240 [candidate division WWE3 bacterium]|nr:hypothetical protein [candidate division WWE3 bacterium]